MLVIDQTGNREKGVKDCLISLRASVSILSCRSFFLTLSMQISVDSDQTQNGQKTHTHNPPPPKFWDP